MAVDRHGTGKCQFPINWVPAPFNFGKIDNSTKANTMYSLYDLKGCLTMPATPTTVRLKEQNRKDIDRFAKLTKRSRSFIVNEAVELYMKNRIHYLEELNAAVDSIDSEPTYPAKEVFAWMNTWGSDEEKSLEESELLTQSRNP